MIEILKSNVERTGASAMESQNESLIISTQALLSESTVPTGANNPADISHPFPDPSSLVSPCSSYRCWSYNGAPQTSDAACLGSQRVKDTMTGEFLIDVP